MSKHTPNFQGPATVAGGRIGHISFGFGGLLLLGCNAVLGGAGEADGLGSAGAAGPVEPVIAPDEAPSASSAIVCSERPPQGALASPLARLSNVQYDNAVQALFPELQVGSTLTIESRDAKTGFLLASSQSQAAIVLDAYELSARAVRGGVDVDLVSGCETPIVNVTACGLSILEELGGRVFRRPLEEEERQRWLAFFESAAAEFSPEEAVEMTVDALLQSPQFLYLLEPGVPSDADPSVVELTPYELASRLAFIVTDAPPDDELSNLAASGALAEPAVLQSQASRLLLSPDHLRKAASFHDAWLEIQEIRGITRSSPAIEGTDVVMDQLAESLERFVANIYQTTGNVGELFSASDGYVNAAIAPAFDLNTADFGPDLRLTSLDPNRRAGVLTHPGWLALHSDFNTDNPVHRGARIASRVLCDPPQPPPAGVDTTLEPLPADAPPMTTRERFVQTHQVDGCANCHVRLDGLGFAFSHYDAIGAYRDTEMVGEVALPIDASGELHDTLDADGPFQNGVELTQRLAESTQVAQCMTLQWFRFVMSRNETAEDTCSIADAFASLERSGGDVREALNSWVKSDGFRFRRMEQ